MTRDFRQPSSFSNRPESPAPNPAPSVASVQDALPQAIRLLSGILGFSALSLFAAGLWLWLARPDFVGPEIAGLLGPLFILVGLFELGVIFVLRKLARRMTPPGA